MVVSSGIHRVVVRTVTLRTVSSFRMQETKATFSGLPADTSRAAIAAITGLRCAAIVTISATTHRASVPIERRVTREHASLTTREPLRLRQVPEQRP